MLSNPQSHVTLGYPRHRANIQQQLGGDNILKISFADSSCVQVFEQNTDTRLTEPCDWSVISKY